MGRTITVTDDTFTREILDPGLPVLIDFGAPRCPPCRMIEPEVEKIAESFGDTIRVAKCNVDENPELQERFSVMSIPTLLMLKNGQVVGQLVGAVPRRMIEELVRKAL